MANGDRTLEDRIATGEVEGTGSAISIFCGFEPRRITLLNIDGGVTAEWFKNMPNASLLKSKVSIAAAENIDVTDNDNAASAGVAVYAATNNGVDAHLEFVSPTDADGTCTLNDGGSTLFLKDNDGAAGGTQVYFDEDGTNADERLLINSPTGSDMFVRLPSGKVIRLNHDASASSNGVALYFDEDASNSYERLLFVSPTDTDGTGATDDTVLNADTNSNTNLQYSSSNGITPTLEGFSIGTDTDINVSAETIHWVAHR